MSTVSKGNYYRLRTQEWLKSKGYDVAKIELQSRIYTKDLQGHQQVAFRKSDVWGGDLVAKSQDELIWIQVKSNPSDISAGKHQLRKAGPWPSFVQLWVVYWPPGARLTDGPHIEEVEA